MTYAERMLWNELRNRKFFGVKFYRQKPLLNYIADFYCSKYNLVIEVDGSVHFGNEAYDNMRTTEFNIYGIRVIRYTNAQIIHHLQDALHDLYRQIFGHALQN